MKKKNGVGSLLSKVQKEGKGKRGKRGGPFYYLEATAAKTSEERYTSSRIC